MGFFSKLFRRDAGPMRDVAALVAPISQPAVVLTLSENATQSWFGGVPRVPMDFVWPRKNGAPLVHLAQIDLREVASAQRFDWLPQEGTLSFFYDLVDFPWGFDPEHEGGWVVCYTRADVAVGECAPPDDTDPAHRIDRRSIAFRAVQVPPADRPQLKALALTDAESDALAELRSGLVDGGGQHQIGGFPEPVQGDEMELECQLVSNGLYCGDASGYEDPRAKELERGAADWRLLLQFDSDDELDVMWGDCGMIYFWVREEDARRADFTRTWTILQCC